ncbi:unnamed protein product, partial [Owenia fusiformis]
VSLESLDKHEHILHFISTTTNDNMKRLWTIVYITGAMFSVASATTCYSCNGENNFRDYEKCKDAFSGLADVKYCSTQCFKKKFEHKLFGNSWYRVERGCASIFDQNEEEWCTTTGQFIYGSGTKITTCYYKDDLCNTGTLITTPALAMITSILATTIGFGIV